MNPPLTPEQRLKNAAKEFSDFMEKMGGGSVSLNGKEIVRWDESTIAPNES